MAAVYHLTTAGTPTEGAPVEGRPGPGVVRFAVPEPEFSVLPELRRWLASRGAEILWEHGQRGPVATVDDAGLYAVLAPRSVSARVQGITPTTQPCQGCGLGLTRMDATAGPVVEHRLPGEQVAAVMGASWVLSDRTVDRLEQAGLADGLHRVRSAFADGEAWAAWGDRELHGVGYPFGPEPCAVCLRASRTVSGELRFIPPRFGLGIPVPYPDDTSGWWWHTVYGQARPVVSGAVAAALQDAERGVSAVHLPRADAPEAFLPEEYR